APGSAAGGARAASGLRTRAASHVSWRFSAGSGGHSTRRGAAGERSGGAGRGDVARASARGAGRRGGRARGEAAMKRVEPIDHTADVGLCAYGADLRELFEAAAEGLFALHADVERVRPAATERIEAHGGDLAELLV